VKHCSDYDIWVRTPELNVSRAQRSSLRQGLVTALQDAGYGSLSSRIGRKAIKLTLHNAGVNRADLQIDVVCVDMDCDCGFNENTLPEFTQASSREAALQQVSEYVRRSDSARTAIRAMKVFRYHGGKAKGGKSVPGFLLNILARRIEAEHPRGQPMSEIQLFRKMALGIFDFELKTWRNQPLDDLEADAFAGQFHGRLKNMLRRSRHALCHNLCGVLSRDESILCKHRILNSCKLPLKEVPCPEAQQLSAMLATFSKQKKHAHRLCVWGETIYEMRTATS